MFLNEVFVFCYKTDNYICISIEVCNCTSISVTMTSQIVRHQKLGTTNWCSSVQHPCDVRRHHILIDILTHGHRLGRKPTARVNVKAGSNISARFERFARLMVKGQQFGAVVP